VHGWVGRYLAEGLQIWAIVAAAEELPTPGGQFNDGGGGGDAAEASTKIRQRNGRDEAQFRLSSARHL
jgi:hypothetical protein